MGNQQNNKYIKLSGFTIWFLELQERETEPDIQPQQDTTGYPVHRYLLTDKLTNRDNFWLVITETQPAKPTILTSLSTGLATTLPSALTEATKTLAYAAVIENEIE